MSSWTSALVRFALPVLLLIAPAAGAEVIDDFETAQGQLTDSGSSVVTDNGVDVILGDHRELEIDLIQGTSPASVEVLNPGGGGVLRFDADAAADTEARALVVWDADTNTSVFDGDGLAGVDLTDANDSTFRIQVEQAIAGTQLILEVFTNDGNSSRAGLRIDTAVVSTTNFYLAYDQFITNLGTGADFADVGAIVLEVRGINVLADISHIETVGPTLSVSKVDLNPADSFNDYGTTPVTPGGTIRYQVTVTNTGGQAESLDLSDSPDGNTSFVADSLTATPVAHADSYSAFGNVTKVVSDGTGVLANDLDPDGTTPFVNVAMSDTTSDANGTVTWNDAGSDNQGEGGFSYLPPAGFQGVDSFAYVLEDVDGNQVSGQVTVVLTSKIWFVDDDHMGANEGTLADPFTDFTQLDDTANDVDQDGDIIFVFAHSGGNYTHAGLELEPGQSLIGEGEGLTVDGIEIVPAGASALIHAPDAGAGTTHGVTLTMNNIIRGVTFGTTEGHAIFGSNFGMLTVSNTTVTGAGGILDVDNGTLAVTLNSSSSSAGPGFGIDLDTVDGSFDAGSTTITGGATGGIRVANGASGAMFDFGGAAVSGVPQGVDLSASGMASFTFDSLDVTTTGTALNLNTAGSVTIGGVTNTLETTASGAAILAVATEMTGGWTFDNITSDSAPADALSLDSMTGGNFLVTGATDINDPIGAGIVVRTGGARTYDFGTTEVTGVSVPAGPIHEGVDIASNPMSTFTFDSLTITTDSGFGLQASNGGTVNIGGTSNSIDANGATALLLDSTTVDEVPGVPVTGITFASVSSTNSILTGISLHSVNGSVTINGGSISGATATAFDVGSAANLSGGASDITYAGSITNTLARSVSVQERNGGTVTLSGNINDTGTGILVTNNNNGVANTVTFSGSSKVVNTGTNIAILLDNNDDATIAFTNGGLDIDTTTATGFNAINGGILEVSGTGNFVTGTRTAVNVVGTTIGSNHLSFQAIDVNGGGASTVPAILLASTGAGQFHVTGSGAAGSGGTLQDILADAVSLSSTGGRVTLEDMIIEDIGNMGVVDSEQDGIHGLTVNGGLTLDNVTIQRISDMAVHGATANGDADTVWNGLTINNSTIQNANRYHVAGEGDTSDEGGVRIRGLRGTATITNSTFQNTGEHLDLFATAGTLSLTATGNSFLETYKEFASGPIASVGKMCVDLTVQNAADATVNVSGSNTFRNCRIGSVRIANDSAATGTITTTVANNSFSVTDHSSGFGGDFDFPMGGVKYSTRGATTAVFDGRISGNTFTDVTNADGGVGNVTLDMDQGVIRVVVDGNTFHAPGNAAWFVRADGTTSFDLLFDNNVYEQDAFPCTTDPSCGGGYNGPGLYNRTQAQNSAVLDVTYRNEDFAPHDTGFDPGNTVEVQVLNVGGGGTVCASFTSNTSPDGYGLEESAGTLNLARGVSALGLPATCSGAAPANCVTVLDDNSNTGGGGSSATDPPTVSVFGTVDIVSSACSVPTGGIFP